MTTVPEVNATSTGVQAMSVESSDSLGCVCEGEFN